MTLKQYWTIVVKRWWLILICFIAVGLGAYIGSRLITPLYQSTVLIQIAIPSANNQGSYYTSLLASEQLVQTEETLATSDPVLREVASHYPGLTVEQLSHEVTAVPKLNTQLFEIDVQDTSPTRAAALANDIAATLIKQQLQAMQLENSRSQQQLQQELDATQRQIDATAIQIAALQAKGGNQAQIAALQIKLSELQQHYNQWQTASAQLELTQEQNADFLRIAQVAQPNFSPVQPHVLLNTYAGLVIGLLLGMLFAVLFELLDTRVPTPEALTQLLGWPVLATIWRARSYEEVINPKRNDTNLEAYRILRTNIGFSAIDKPLHTLVVTSATLRDGKSIVAANLAIFMAKSGKNTLLIDADLRRPIQHNLFGIPADKMGLSNAILAFSMPTAAHPPACHQVSATTPIQPEGTAAAAKSSLDPFVYATDIPNLCVMPAGPLPPNPPELLDSKAMKHLFTALASCGTEVVIFDTSPLLGLSDASILASKVDATLVVVDITRARKGSLKQVKALMAQAGARVLGCVVNKQRHRRNDTAYSYYYYGTDEQNNGGNHRTNNVNSLPGLPVTPGVLKEQEIPSQPDPIEQNDGKDQRTSYVNSPAVHADAFDASDQTIKLPRKNRRKDEQSEDG